VSGEIAALAKLDLRRPQLVESGAGSMSRPAGVDI